MVYSRVPQILTQKARITGSGDTPASQMTKTIPPGGPIAKTVLAQVPATAIDGSTGLREASTIRNLDSK
jgi:hypothetical protein